MATLPLNGVRIIDLTQALAGPLATRLMADMGAEVIRVESRLHLDGCRPAGAPLDVPRELAYNKGGHFQLVSRNKLSLTLELDRPRGVEIFKSLLRIADVVVENFSARVMKNLDLEYETIREVRPDIIMLSMPGYGKSGPYKDFLAWGEVLEPMSGLSSLTGYPDGPPMKLGNAYSDSVAGFNGAFAVMVALHHRRRTGQGQFIELSQHECLIRFIGEAVLDCTMNKRVQTRMGNRHPYIAPHGVYRCLGEDKWVAISVSTDEEWHTLCESMGMQELKEDLRFADPLSRYKNQDELNKIIEGWTSKLDQYEVMHLLQKAGVAAGPALTWKGLLEDSHLRERGFFVRFLHPGLGVYPYQGMAFKLTRTPGGVRMPAPKLGEHNEWALGDLLGLPRDVIEELSREGLIGTEPIMPKSAKR